MKFICPFIIGGCLYAAPYATADEATLPNTPIKVEDTVNGIKTALNFAGKYTNSCFSVSNSLCFGKEIAAFRAY